MELKLTDSRNDRSRAHSLHSGRSIGPRRRRWSGRDEQRTVVKRNSYAPFGETFAPTVIDGTGYTGHVTDQATGLTYMQARYYDPQIGRFLSTDPVPTNANTGSNFNSYWYANNNPYRFTDPDGRESVGELIDGKAMQAISEGSVASGYAWAFAATAWNYLGAEGLSQTLDKGSNAGAGNNAMAVLEVATLGKGGAALRVGEKLAEGAAKLSIKGLTSHAVDQAINRGVKPAQIVDAIKSPLKIAEVKVDALGRASQKIVGATATIVVNPATGKIVTVYPTSAKVAEKLMKEAK